MKLRNKNMVDEGSSVIKESKLEIGDQAFVLDLLMKDLYSNPIEAICREITSNCMDAHREANTVETPVKIVLPNLISQKISFTDYGPGISPDRVERIFTKVGKSTKRDSNDEIGGFGLGAKTPFSYTSQFSIGTISKIETQEDVDLINASDNGNLTLEEAKGHNINCEWTASRGSGSTKLHFATLTDDHTGTTISLAVKKDDTNLFKNAVAKFVRHWKVAPNIIGDIEIPEPRGSIMEGDGWRLLRRNTHWSPPKYAIIDGVEYPLELNVKDRELTNQFERLSFELEFSTGDLELIPSREALLYEEKTKEAITNRLKTFSEEIEDCIESEVKKKSTYQEALVTVTEFRRYADFRISDNLSWNGSKLHHHNSHARIVKLDDDSDIRVYSYIKQYNRNIGGHKLKRSEDSTVSVIDTIVINDSGSKNIPRSFVEAFSKDMDTDSTFSLITSLDGDSTKLRQWVSDKIDVKVEHLKFVNLSEHKVEADKISSGGASGPRKKRQVGTTVVRKFSGRYSSYWVDEERINRKDGSGIYVSLMDRHSVIRTKAGVGSYVSPNNLKDICRILGIDVLYGISDSNIEKLGSGWVSLQEVIDKRLNEEKIDDVQLKEYKIAHLSYVSIDKTALKVYECGAKLDSSLKATLDSLKEKGGKFVNYSNLLSSLGDRRAASVHVADSELVKVNIDISMYPMLSMIKSWQIDHDIATVTEYIKLVDATLSLASSLKSA